MGTRASLDSYLSPMVVLSDPNRSNRRCNGRVIGVENTYSIEQCDRIHSPRPQVLRYPRWLPSNTSAAPQSGGEKRGYTL